MWIVGHRPDPPGKETAPMSTPETVPTWPRIEAVAREDGTGEVIVDGAAQSIAAGTLDEVRVAIIRNVTDIADRLGRPVRVSTSGPDGYWPLIVHPDGVVAADVDDQPRPGRRAAVEQPAPAGAAGGGTEPAAAAPTPEHPADLTDFEPAESGTAAEPALPADQPPTDAAGVVDHRAARSDDAATPGDGRLPLHRGAAPTTPAAPTGPWPDHDQAVPTRTTFQPAPEPSHRSTTPPPPAQPTRTFGQPPQQEPQQPPQQAPGPYVAQRSADPSAPPAPRQSFLTREQIEEPASRGFRGFLGKVGIKVAPNEAERAERSDAQAVSQHWPGPRTIAIVNGKGGAGKSPTTILLSAVFARFGGAGVIAWDNNQTRGTLGWRTEQGPHEASLHDLLPEIPRLLSTQAQSADLAHYVHHQSRDRYDVLRSKPMVLAHLQRLDPQDVDAIHAVLGKYYRLIFIDSGNDESDPMWLRMIDLSDQLVVATTTRDDHAEAGALLLEALADRDEHSAALARSSVAVVSQADPTAKPSDLARVAAGYQALTRATVTIPFDPAMVDGLLRYASLKPETQRAWLAAAAAVARGL
jgi:MinD-like ATPase involved in chromosome partitioning or flagellar assembly